MIGSSTLEEPFKKREAQLAFLYEEWKHCETGIARYDTLHFQIRSWAITLSVAVIAASATLKVPEVAFAGAIIALLFWWNEALHDCYQGIFIVRVRNIQRKILKIHETGSELPNLGRNIAEAFSGYWQRSWYKNLVEVLNRAIFPNVAITYVCLVALSLGWFWLSKNFPSMCP